MLMGHGSKKMVYENYGKYMDGLEADQKKILAFLGTDFVTVAKGKIYKSK